MGEERFSQLFRELDVNRDGVVDVKELETGLKRLGVNWTQDQAQVSNKRTTEHHQLPDNARDVGKDKQKNDRKDNDMK